MARAWKNGVVSPGIGISMCKGLVMAWMSAPVKTAITPGSWTASPTSMLVMRAWAKGLRRNAACTIPGSCTSST